MRRGLRKIRLAIVLSSPLIVAVSCSPSGEAPAARADATGPVAAPAPLLALAEDALRASAEVKVRGDVEAVLRTHPLAPKYRDALQPHFALMRRLHEVGLRSRLRYPGYELSVEPREFCSDGRTAKLLLAAAVKFTMEGIPPDSGVPPYTAGGEEHVFHFRNEGGEWMISDHYEITLAEMHDPARVRRLRHPCAA